MHIPSDLSTLADWGCCSGGGTIPFHGTEDFLSKVKEALCVNNPTGIWQVTFARLSAVVCKPQRGILITCGQRSAPWSGEFLVGAESRIGVVLFCSVLLCWVSAFVFLGLDS